jgi:RHS repeat-associated protein
LYDGSGKRIKKVTNLETTIFVYSGSKLIAEYSTQLATNPTTSYTVTDMLGSPRVITDANGQVISRRDFMAFGEEITVNVGGRTSANKYGQTDSVRQRFTGYQKDDETGLDFAEARYYNDAHGRFTAVDPLLASGKSVNPQTFNRYVYTMNRPLILTDETGLQAGKKAVYKIKYVEEGRKNLNGEKLGGRPSYGQVVQSGFVVTKNGKSVTLQDVEKSGDVIFIREKVTNKSDTIVKDGQKIDTPSDLKKQTQDFKNELPQELYNEEGKSLKDRQGMPATSEEAAQTNRDLQRTSVDEVTFTLSVNGNDVASTTIVSTKTIDTVKIEEKRLPEAKPPVKKPKRRGEEEE